MKNQRAEKDNSHNLRQRIVVQKYGGATLSDPNKIKQVAQRIAELSSSGTQVVAAVSAMGKTTNQLISLAQQVSSQPNRRELDMLLTTGERVSMALLSMALHDQHCDAISFTGSQAGILTDEAHVNASIVDVKAHRVVEALDQGKVVVLAGFQGVSPVSKEITTLGRGGTDTTAIAMAAFLKAERCEILKDVPGVFSADPKIVPQAKPIQHLSYDQMLDMTFWGAKVLHYRSVELAKIKQVQIYIGPAANSSIAGTLIPSKESSVFETTKILSLNSHSQVLEVEILASSAPNAFEVLQRFLLAHEIASPQILLTEGSPKSQLFFITGPEEIISAITRHAKDSKELVIKSSDLCSVTATCTGITTPELTQKVFQVLDENQIAIARTQFSGMSLTLYLKRDWLSKSLNTLHQLV
jgi:aspartate kinase